MTIRSGHAVLALALWACGGDGTGPTEVTFGETTFVILVNPPLNDINQATVPPPGTVRSGVSVAVEGGPSGTTDANGVVVLADVEPGTRTISLSGSGLSGTVTVSIADRDLREVAVALTDAGAAVMANVQYAFGGQVVEVTPTMSLADVNAELAKSNVIVFFNAGTYSGELVFAGSNVTLFGEGTRGGQVTLNGNVEIPGSANRVRGARITQGLSVTGSDVGFSFGQVVGALTIEGSDAVLLNNAICGSVDITGGATTALGNVGLAPLAAPAGGC